MVGCKGSEPRLALSQTWGMRLFPRCLRDAATSVAEGVRALLKPSQTKVLTWGAETCASRNSKAPCLLAIPAFDLVVGLYDRNLNSNRGYIYANGFKVRLRALTDIAREWRLDGSGRILGGVNFAWLAGCVPSPDWLCRKPGMRLFSGA